MKDIWSAIKVLAFTVIGILLIIAPDWVNATYKLWIGITLLIAAFGGFVPLYQKYLGKKIFKYLMRK